MDNPVIILGARALGRVALDIFQSNGIVVYGFLDEDKKLKDTEISGIAVLGETDDEGYLKLLGRKCEAAIATEDVRMKKFLLDMLKEKRKMVPVNGVHKLSMLSQDVQLGHGNLIAAGACLMSGVQLSDCVTIMPGVQIEPMCTIGNFAHIGTGTVLGADLNVGEGVFIGTGCTIVPGLKIGKNARIGAGSVVVDHVPDGSTVFGNPAAKV